MFSMNIYEYQKLFGLHSYYNSSCVDWKIFIQRNYVLFETLCERFWDTMNRHFAKTAVGEFDTKDEMMIVIVQSKLEDFTKKQKSL